MRRILLLVLVAVVLLAGFYVAWPAWTARSIRNAIEANDPAALERKIDFARVRERAKPLIAAEMERSLERLKQGSGGIGAAIAGQLKGALGGKIAEAAVDSILTPANVVAMVRQGKDLRRVIREIGSERKTGGPQQPGAPAETPPQGSEQAKEPKRLGLANLKSYRITGPLALAVGVAREASATEPDVTAELEFIGGDWKVVGIVPRL